MVDRRVAGRKPGDTERWYSCMVTGCSHRVFSSVPQECLLHDPPVPMDEEPESATDSRRSTSGRQR